MEGYREWSMPLRSVGHRRKKLGWENAVADDPRPRGSGHCGKCWVRGNGSETRYFLSFKWFFVNMNQTWLLSLKKKVKNNKWSDNFGATCHWNSRPHQMSFLPTSETNTLTDRPILLLLCACYLTVCTVMHYVWPFIIHQLILQKNSYPLCLWIVKNYVPTF